MSNLTYNQLIEQTRQFQKQAAVKLAEITGESVEDMPGSEHDGKVPASFLEPDPQVADGTMGPDSARSIEGAGDDRPITAGSLFESDESALNPEKKPMESSDWEAKSASAAMANDILSLVMGTKQASDNQAVASQTADKQAAPARDELELTSDILCKIAASLLSSDEGVQIVQDHLEKTAGARDAEYIMNTLAEKSAEVQQGEQDAEYLIMKVAQAIAEEEAAEEAAEAAEEDMGDEDVEDISVDDVVEAVVELVEDGEISADEGAEILEAVGADEGVDEYEDEVEDLEDIDEYEDEVEDLEDIDEYEDEDAEAEFEAGEKTAEALIVKVAQAIAEEEAAAEEAAAAEEDISTEELAQGIEEMLDSGELSEEDAQSLIVELMDQVPPEVAEEVEGILNEEGAAEEEAAMDPAMAGEAAMDPAAMGMAPEMTPEMAPKTASARDFSKFDALVYSLKNRLYR
jgi:hypothetical protein